jgi:hypothetical protein
MKRVPHIAGVLLAVAVVVGLTFALNNDYYLRILFMMGVYYLCAAGMNVLVGYAGQKSLGQAGLFAAGAYAVALLTTRTEISPWVALALAAVVSGVFGVLIALPSLRVKGPYLAMVTLAFGIVVEKLVSEWTDVFGGAQGVYGIRPLSWGEEPLSTQQWVWLTVALCAITHLLLRNLVGGRFGRALLSLSWSRPSPAASRARWWLSRTSTSTPTSSPSTCPSSSCCWCCSAARARSTGRWWARSSSPPSTRRWRAGPPRSTSSTASCCCSRCTPCRAA